MVKKATPAKRAGFYQVEVRPESQFTELRTYDVGESTQRVAGKKRSGSWATQKWMISKSAAHVENGMLIADKPKVRQILTRLPGRVVQRSRSTGRPQVIVPKRLSITPAQRRARQQNMRKAQRARWRS